MDNARIRTPRLMAGLAGLALVLGIITIGLYGAPKATAATRPAAHHVSGGSASRVVPASRRPLPSYGFQYCYYNQKYACVNAWGGGPWVDTYTGGPEGNDTNQLFTVISTASGVGLSWTGGNGECVGDAYNNSGYADTSLDPCGSGWGTNFTTGNSGCKDSSDTWFYNTHWHGYLGPPSGWTNGSHFYLDKPGPYCFSESIMAIKRQG